MRTSQCPEAFDQEKRGRQGAFWVKGMKAAVNKAEMERSESWVTRVPAQDMI